MTTATETSIFEHPLYADRPRRRIDGTDYVAIRRYRSHDGTVAEYPVVTADGKAILGTAHYHPQRSIFPRCYTLDRCRTHRSERWPSLAAFADEMARRLDAMKTSWHAHGVAVGKDGDKTRRERSVEGHNLNRLPAEVREQIFASAESLGVTGLREDVERLGRRSGAADLSGRGSSLCP